MLVRRRLGADVQHDSRGRAAETAARSSRSSVNRLTERIFSVGMRGQSDSRSARNTDEAYNEFARASSSPYTLSSRSSRRAPRKFLVDERAARRSHRISRAGSASALAIAAGQRFFVAGRHEPSGDSGMHLVRQSACTAGDDRPPVRHGLERDERAAFVERGMDEQRRRLVPTVQIVRLGAPPHHDGVAQAGRRRSRARKRVAHRAVADEHPPPPLRQAFCCHQSRPARGSRTSETLVGFEAADADEQHVIGLQPEFARATPARATRRIRPIAVRELDGVGNDANDILADVEMRDDGSRRANDRSQ